MIIEETNISVAKVVKVNGYQLTWKTLNKVDRLSLSDTDERAKVMPRLRMRIGGVDNILFKGLTIGPN
jgi:hypothetical protein